MKIKLFYIHPTNYGNLMMASSFIYYFDLLWKEKYGETPSFYLDVLDDKELERVKKSLPTGIKVYRETLFNRKRRGIIGKIEKLINIPREIYYNRKNYDICVALGGDCISQYYSSQVFISDMIKFKFISLKRPFYLQGQTMGPFHGYAVKLVQSCLKACKIYVRDHDCYEYITGMYQFPYIKEARDLAFLDIPYQNDSKIQKEVLKKYVGSSSYITIVPSGADKQYTSKLENYIEEYVKIINNVLFNTNYDILLLAHVIHVQDSNDKKIIDLLLPKLEEKYKERIHVVNFLLQPYEARILLGNGLATITGRMHAAVSSINMGTLPICLSYSVKYKGVIGDEFDLNNYIYQCRGDEWWTDGLVSENVCKMLYQVLNNRQEIVDRLKIKLDNVKEQSMRQIEAIVEETKK